MTMGWRAWYADGQIYDSTQTDWCHLPEIGVIAVMVYAETGRRIMQGTDYYWLKDDVLGHGDDLTTIVFIHKAGPEAIKRGIYVSDVTFHKIMEAANSAAVL